MSFFNALVSPFFWAFTVAAAGLLGAGWGVLWWRQRRGRRAEEERRLFWSWVLFAGITSASILLGREGFALVVGLLALFACKEFARATGLYEDWLFTGTVYVSILAVNLVAQWPGYDAFMATPIYAVALFCLLPVARNRAEGMLQRVALSVMGFVYFGYFLAHLSLLASVPDPRKVYACLFFMLYGTATAALAGWLAAQRFGRHPLLPRFGVKGPLDGPGSPAAPGPDLTREGAAASLAWAGLWSFTLGWLLPDFPWPAMLLSTVLFGIMGPLGDLVMRYIHRDLGLRPASEAPSLVPYLALSHLNRLIFVAPLFFRLIHWFDPHVLG
jgi:phosphatidate cytidylyltransferase